MFPTDFRRTQISNSMEIVQQERSFSIGTDGHDEANSRFSQFRISATKQQHNLVHVTPLQ